MVNFNGTGQFSKERIAAIARELQRQKVSKRDMVVGVGQLKPMDNGGIALSSVNHVYQVRADGREFVDFVAAEQWIDGARERGVEGADQWKIEIVNGISSCVPLNKTATSQLLDRLGVPGRFASALKDKGYSDVLGNLLRDLATKGGEDGGQFLLRMLDGKVRAVLSPKYRILESADLFFKAFETFQKCDAEIWDARLWDDGFELYAVREGTSGEITTDRAFREGGAHGWGKPDGPDEHNPAVRLRNSETGRGGLHVSFSVLRQVCKNFLVMDTLKSQIHLGGRLTADDSGLIVSDQTKQKEAELMWSTIGDAVQTAFDEDRFRAFIDQANDATGREIAPREAVALVAVDLTEELQQSILGELLASGDRSQYGLTQAITSQSHDLYDSDPVVASQCEALGGNVLRMTADDLAAVLV